MSFSEAFGAMFKRPVLLVSAALLAACGSDSEAVEPPVEQIIVREPGTRAAAVIGAAPAANAVRSEMAAAQSGSGGALALIAAGKAAFGACTGCHAIEAGKASGAAPNLHGVVGRKAGGLSDFSYSEAMAGSGIVWDRASLDRFLANPAGYVAGTQMVAGGVRDAERRAAIVAYLASTSSNFGNGAGQ